MKHQRGRIVFLFQLILEGCLILVAVPLAGQEPLLRYEFERTTNPSFLHENLIAGDVTLSEGTILFQAGTDQLGAAIGYATGWNQEAFSTTGKYLEFSLTPQPGYQINLSSLGFRFGRTLSGPTQVTIQYSLSNFVLRGLPLLENAPVISLSANNLDDFQLPVAGLPPEAISSRITFRIWGHDATGSGSLKFNNFTVTGSVTETTGCDPSTLFFRSRQNGSWHDINSWESSSNDSGPWNTAECIPDSRAETILIQAFHSILVSEPVIINQLTIKGILEAGVGSAIILAPPAGEALIIEQDGVLLFNGGNVPVFYDLSVMARVKAGGVIQVDHSLTEMSQKLAGNESAIHYVYEHGGIFNWNTSQPFSSKDQVYFPAASQEVIPIFRISQPLGFVGAGTATRINGLLDANAAVTWQYSGSKTFRNGITGTGKVRQNNNTNYFCGPFIISGNTALLGGPGILEMNANGLTITAKNTAVVSDKAFVGGPVVLAGHLDAGQHIISFSGDLFMTQEATWEANLSTLIFDGVVEQQLTAEYPLKLFNLSIANSQGLKVSQPMSITNLLNMTGGNIEMQGYLLEIGSSPAAPGTLEHLSGTIMGPVRRWFNNNIPTGKAGLFPVGTPVSHNPLLIDFTTIPNAGSITARFINTKNLPENYYGNLPFAAGDLFINVLADHGFWQLDAAAGMIPGTFTLALDASGFGGIYLPQNVRILSRDTQSNDWGLEGHPQVYEDNMTFVNTGMSTLGQYALGGFDKENPLPITLLSFTASRTNDQVALWWTTASEINNAFFCLERSTDALTAQPIGWVAGAGYSTQTLHYSFLDRSPPQHRCYYRLRQVDHDGREQFSHWIVVEEGPTPGSLQVISGREQGKGWLKVVNSLDTPVQVTLVDIRGRVLLRNTYDASPGQFIIHLPQPLGVPLLIYRIGNVQEVLRGKVVW